MADVKVSHPVAKMLVGQIEEGIAKIEEANKTLLTEETGTPVREIDKVFKDDEKKAELPKELVTLWDKADAAYKIYRENVEAARNQYRVTILGEEAKESSDADETTLKSETKDIRKVVMDALSFLTSFAAGNNLPEVSDWASKVTVPQVGRQGTSTVGAKKPRVYVKVDDVVYESFSQAAAKLSTKEHKYTAGDLATAWNEAGGAEGEFEFEGKTFGITYKPKGNK